MDITYTMTFGLHPKALPGNILEHSRHRRLPGLTLRPVDLLPVQQGEPGADRHRRVRIWELHAYLHCSIIGTCLTSCELRQILTQLKIEAVHDGQEHELHGIGVSLAGHRDRGAKFIQRALDRRHEATIKRYSAAKDTAALADLWSCYLKNGDIPGAYWALLTHPLTDNALVKRAFGEVHMLSHIVGAANRADIRRLRELEEEKAALTDKLVRAQRRIQEGFHERDQTIRRLNDLLARSVETSPHPQPAHEASPADADNAIRDMSKKLAREAALRERAETRARTCAQLLADKERELTSARAAQERMAQELQIVEEHFLAPTQAGAREPTVTPLAAMSILYVGGRTGNIPQLKELIEQAAGCFQHHDGGIEDSLAQLPGLISRADVVVFPVDCVSHSATALIKRICKNDDRPYVPLRSSSLTCLMAALPRMTALLAPA